MNYRQRCYQSYVSTHWAYSHSITEKEYKLYAKVYKKRYKDILPANKEAKIIDIACGAGHFLYFLQSEGYINAQGIDISEEQLEVARKMGVNNIKKADLFEYLPKHSESFDMIVANDIVEHLKKDEVLELLDLVFKALKPSGKVLIATVNAQSLFGSSIVFIDFTHEQGFTPMSLLQVLRVCNFKDVKVYGEKPIAYDFRSGVRVGLWWGVTKILKTYKNIERGTGRGLSKPHDIFEPRIFAIGNKLEEGNQ